MADKTGSGSPVCCPECLVFAGSKLPTGAEGIAVALEPHRAVVEAIEKRQRTRAESPAREHSLVSRRNLEAASRRLIRSQARCRRLVGEARGRRLTPVGPGRLPASLFVRFHTFL